MKKISLNEKIVLDVILAKKELQNVDLAFAFHELEAFLQRDAAARKYLLGVKLNDRSREFKRIVSSVRSILRRAHSLFEVGNRSRDYLRYVNELKLAKSYTKLTVVAKKILNSHASSAERSAEYEKFYGFVTRKIKAFSSVVDLGAGLHPMSIVYLPKTKLSGLNYLAIDINNFEQDLLELFFKQLSGCCKGFKGDAKLLNLRNAKDIKKLGSLKKVDLALMLKLTDHLDRGSGHKQTELVLTSVNARTVLVSFPTVTRSGARMRYPKRKWVEYLCERLGYGFEEFELSNELFYFVKKD